MGTFYLSAWDSFGPWFHASRKRAEEERNEGLGGAGRGWEGLGGAGGRAQQGQVLCDPRPVAQPLWKASLRVCNGTLCAHRASPLRFPELLG